MKKNLKKVISAVIALAMSLSSVVALAANKSFTDVAETANYYQAVTTLANLGIIAGYEDGSFKPDDNITRAEVTTMVVAAMNMTEQAKSMEGTTKFSDVQSEATKWASGYINVGVNQKFIAGFEDGTFRPSENVTYAQIVTMLVGALNYGDYATYLGGYPQGYISIGQTSGLTKNVAGNAEDVVTRGQVAMLINNFLDTCKVEMGGISYTSDGRLVPTIKIQDGTDDSYYKTILTENWNIYILEGTVADTSKSDDTLDADEIKFSIGKTKEKGNVNGYNDPSSDDINEVGTIITANVGATDAANYLNNYATIYAEYTDDDEWVIKNFITSSKNKTVTFAANLVDDSSTGYDLDGDGQFIRFYASTSANKSTKYNLDDAAVLYVNGVKVNALDADLFAEYILNNDAGEVELVDTYAAGAAADGYYDIVNVTYYATGRVEDVNASTGKVSFKNYSDNMAGSLKLDDEDDDLEYTITYNGDAITVADILEDDVLTIAYDVTAGAFKDSKFYDVQVARDVVEGAYTGNNKDDRQINFAGSKYEFTELGEVADGKDKTDLFLEKVDAFTLVRSNEYTAYLDVFGKIFDMEIQASATKLAIVDKVVTSSTYDNYGITLFTTDGVVKTYEVDDDIKDWEKASDAKANVYKEDGETKKDVQDRVVSYKLNSKGIITSLEVASVKATAEGDEYRPLTGALGSVRLGSATKVVDATKYVDTNKSADLAMSSVDVFAEDIDYTAYAFGTKYSDNTYELVVVTEGEGVFNEDTRLAVLTSTVDEIVYNSDDAYAINVLNADGDEEVQLPLAEDVEIILANGSTGDEDDLAKSDVVVYALDADGMVSHLTVVFQGSAYETTDALMAALVAGEVDVNTPAKAWTALWDSSDKDHTVQIVVAPIVDKTTSSVVLGKIAKIDGNVITNLNVEADDEADNAGVLEVGIDSAAQVYRYSTTAPSRNNLEKGSKGDLVKYGFSKTELLEDGTIVPWESLAEDDEATFVVAKILNGVLTDAVVITDAE